MHFTKIVFVATITVISGFTFHPPADAEADKVQGTWLNQEGTSHIQVYRAVNGAFAGKYYGKIVWLKEPNENGKPKMDKNNPETGKRNTPLLNLVILRDFTYDSEDKEWSGGTIYDPKNGKTYSCYMSLDGSKLNVRGYVGVSIIGRTTVWTRVK